MATLTYDSNEQAEGELTAEEQDSLKVGEALAEQEGKKLAGNLKMRKLLKRLTLNFNQNLENLRKRKLKLKKRKRKLKKKLKKSLKKKNQIMSS